ncbi:signal peptidase II [Cohnella yongneupensis]|uniref:Lipoprotein signal peptidase n=1 Tax=Cohnella yongneupensis TaxID=425006 RepID=A0ABW0R5H3_9BACL
MQRRRWPIWAYYAIAVIVFVLDFVTKKIIDRNVQENTEQIKVLGNFFVISHIRNRGAAFGILQDQRWFFILITLIVVSAIIWYLHRSYRNGRGVLLFGLGMVLGGAVGNFLDRSLFGEVVDFLQFNFGSYTFPLFNVADCGIVCGVGLVILDALLNQKQENEPNDNGEQTRERGEQPTA